MFTDSNPATVGLLLSGGLDSSILLGHLLERGEHVQPFFICTGIIWEPEELRAVRQLLAHWMAHEERRPRLEELVVLAMPLGDLYQGHWSLTGRAAPSAAEPDEAVYLPGRNLLLLLKAALWCQLRGVPKLALASLGTNPFADATPQFFQQFQSLVNQATGGSVEIVCPFEKLNKRDVMQLGRRQPLGLTFSCLAPVDGLHCGQCNKCAERQAAFRVAELPDPSRYASALVEPRGAVDRA